MVEALTHFQDQYPIVLGDLNSDIQAQNPSNQQVVDILVEFRLVYIQHHLGSSGGTDTCNMVSDAAGKIIAENM